MHTDAAVAVWIIEVVVPEQGTAAVDTEVLAIMEECVDTVEASVVDTADSMSGDSVVEDLIAFVKWDNLLQTR